MWPSVPVARSNAEQCRVVPSVPTDIRQHSAAATALAPPSTATAVVVWLPPRAHLLVTRSPGLVTMTAAPITPDLVEWLLADQKVNQVSIILSRYLLQYLHKVFLLTDQFKTPQMVGWVINWV